MAAERIGDEVVKILTEGSARRGFELLDATGLLPVVLPEVARMHGVAQSPDHHPEGDVWEHTLLLLDQLAPGVPETLALGALLHDVAKPLCAGRKGDRITFYGHPTTGANLAVEICQRLRRSRATWKRVDYLVRHHLRLVQAPEMRLATLKKMSGDLRFVLFCERRKAELGAEALRPPRLLGGTELLALGYRAGPRIGEILRALEDAQLEGEVRTREDAEALVRARFPVEP
jgi:poly(A) polymerase